MQEFQYQNIYQFYKHAILSGEYSVGDLLPSEADMCRQFQVTRMTIRQALDLLVQDGLITKHKGKGSIVGQTESLGLLNVKGFSDAIGEHHNVGTQFITGPLQSEWPSPFFFKLPAQHASAKCIFMKRLRFVQDQPVMLESTYIPDISLEHFCNKPLVNGSLFATLENRYHAHVIKTEQNLRAIIPDPETIKYLRIAKGTPVLQIFLKFTTYNKNITVYSNLLCNTQEYFISNQIS